MKWTELWEAVVALLWHCQHDRVEQCCDPPREAGASARCLQVCADCGSVRWLPDSAGWRRPARLTALAATMPMLHTSM